MEILLREPWLGTEYKSLSSLHSGLLYPGVVAPLCKDPPAMGVGNSSRQRNTILKPLGKEWETT